MRRLLIPLFSLTFLFALGCDCSSPAEGSPCESTGDCEGALTCRDGLCTGGLDASLDAAPQDSGGQMGHGAVADSGTSSDGGEGDGGELPPGRCL